MQPTLAILAPHPGLIYLNGNFAGEISDGAPLLRPINPMGALYLEYRPLSDACRPMARRLVFSGGRLLAEAADAAEGLNAVIWPGNVNEIELSPQPWDAAQQVFTRNGRQFLLEGGAEPKIYCEGRLLSPLPPGAEMPEYHSLKNGSVLLGNCREGNYLLSADSAFNRSTGFLRAREISLEGENIRALVAPGDTAGHAARESWQLLPEGLQLIRAEDGWKNGAPHIPASPEEAALAAVEAAIAGFWEEAEGYLTPRLREEHILSEITNSCDLCVKMKYAPPGAQPSIGLLSLEGAHIAQVRPLLFRAVQSETGPQSYLIDEFEQI